MSKLEKTIPKGYPKFKPRFFYFFLHSLKDDKTIKDKKIFGYPKDYGTDKNNDDAIIELEKDDNTADEIKKTER